MNERGRHLEATVDYCIKVPLPRAATPPPVIPPASGFENDDHEEEHVELVEQVPASEHIRRASLEASLQNRPGGSRRRSAGPLPPTRRSSSGSLAASGSSRRSKTVDVIGPHATSTTASKRGYHCCSKREKSSALAALIGCISLATLMTSLVTDLWLDTDEWIPSSTESGLRSASARPPLPPATSQPDLPNVQQARHHGEGVPPQVKQTVRRVHFTVGLWTLCPSHEDHEYVKSKSFFYFLTCSRQLLAL